MVDPTLHRQVVRQRHADLVRPADARTAMEDPRFEPRRPMRETPVVRRERVLDARTFFIARSGSAA